MRYINTACLFLFILTGTVARLLAQDRNPYPVNPVNRPPHHAQEKPAFWIANNPDPFRALEMYFSAQEMEQARFEAEERLQEQLRDRELRKKVAELVETSNKLHERLNNPFVPYEEIPKLANKSAKLARNISKLMR